MVRTGLAALTSPACNIPKLTYMDEYLAASEKYEVEKKKAAAEKKSAGTGK